MLFKCKRLQYKITAYSGEFYMFSINKVEKKNSKKPQASFGSI